MCITLRHLWKHCTASAVRQLEMQYSTVCSCCSYYCNNYNIFLNYLQIRLKNRQTEIHAVPRLSAQCCVHWNRSLHRRTLSQDLLHLFVPRHKHLTDKVKHAVEEHACQLFSCSMSEVVENYMAVELRDTTETAAKNSQNANRLLLFHSIHFVVVLFWHLWTVLSLPPRSCVRADHKKWPPIWHTH